jgi:hypothetical protein
MLPLGKEQHISYQENSDIFRAKLVGGAVNNYF